MENILGSRIKMLREDKGLNQLKLSAKLNISNTTLSQYENGARIPSDDIKIKIADFFGVSLDYLLGKSNIKNLSNEAVSPITKELIEMMENLPTEDIEKVKEYVALLKLKQKNK